MANEFRPERWLRKDNLDRVDNFGSIPFGYGIRSCIGKRVAELEIHLALIQVRYVGLHYRKKNILLWFFFFLCTISQCYCAQKYGVGVLSNTHPSKEIANDSAWSVAYYLNCTADEKFFIVNQSENKCKIIQEMYGFSTEGFLILSKMKKFPNVY